jgi:O-antigen/teichoic acid export membrane protein
MGTMEQPTIIASDSESATRGRAHALVTDVGALSVLQVLQRLPGLILLPFISKGLGAGAYGVWTLFFVVGEMIGILCDLALDDALVRFVPGLSSRDEQCEYFYSLTGISAGLSLIPALIVAFFPELLSAWLFGSAANSLLVRLLAVYLMMEALDGMALNMLRALLRVKLFVYLEASQLIVRTAFVIAVLLAGASFPVALSVYVAIQFVWLLAEFAIVYRFVGFRWPTFKYVRSCLAYSLPLVPTRYSLTTLTYSDRLIIAWVFGPAAAGVYAASYDLALVIWHMLNPIRVALYPAISRLWDEGRREETGQYLTSAMKYALLLALPAIVGLTALAPQLLRLLATDEFARASRWIVPIAAVGILLSSLAAFFNLMLRLHKSTRLIAASLMISAASHLLLNLILIPAIGITGGAIATVAGYAIDFSLSGWFAWRRSRFELPFRSTVISLVATLVMLPVVILIGGGTGWASVLGAAASGVVVYFTVLLGLGGVTRQEIQSMRHGRQN